MNSQIDRPTLFLITSSYPFDSSKEGPFLEREIKELRTQFEVVLVPRVIKGTRYRDSSKGLELDTSLARDLRVVFDGNVLEKFSRVLLLFFRPGFLTRAFFKSLAQNLYSFNTAALLPTLLAAALGDFMGRQWVRRNSERFRLKKALVYGYWLTPEVLGIASSSNIPVVARAHGTDLYADRQSPPIFPLRDQRLNSLAAVFPCSNHGARYLKARFPDFGSRVSTRYLGTPDYKVEVLGRKGAKRYIVSCSFLDPIKQVHLIAEGLSHISDRLLREDITWVHFGDGPLRAKIEQLAEELLGDLAAIRLFPGHDGLRDFYASNDVLAFVNSSKSEGLPVSLMEAASFGIPLIGPDVGGIREIVHDRANGYLLEDGASARSIAGAISNLLDLPPSRILDLGARSRSIWEKSHNAAIVYKSFCDDLLDYAQLNQLNTRRP